MSASATAWSLLAVEIDMSLADGIILLTGGCHVLYSSGASRGGQHVPGPLDGREIAMAQQVLGCPPQPGMDHKNLQVREALPTPRSSRGKRVPSLTAVTVSRYSEVEIDNASAYGSVDRLVVQIGGAELEGSEYNMFLDMIDALRGPVNSEPLSVFDRTAVHDGHDASFQIGVVSYVALLV